jgi:hypothetical protein
MFVLDQLRRDLNQVRRGFAGAKNHFGKTASQAPMHVDLGETQVSHRGRLKRLQDPVPAQLTRSKSFQ